VRILLLLPEYVNNAGGGIITFYRHFLPLLAAQGHQVRVIVGSGVWAGVAPSPTLIDGVSVETLSHAKLSKYYAQFARYASMPGLRRHLAAAWAMWDQAGRGEGFDVVEATDWGLLFLPWVVEAGPPCVVQLHGSIGQIDEKDPVRGEEIQGHLVRLIERAGISQSIGIQALSHANGEFWQHQTRRKVDRILPAWQPLLLKETMAVKKMRGLVVGRVQRWKGPEVLCQAMQLMGQRAPGIDWIGRDTPYERRQTMTSAHLAKNWPEVWGQRILHKAQQPAEVTAVLQAEAAFMVVPSLWDTFNFTCVEAMGAGTVVICSSGAGASELIENRVNGFVFENGNAASLAGALDHFFGLSDVERRSVAEAGRQTVLEAMNPVNRAIQRLGAYEALVVKGQQPSLVSDDWLRLAAAPVESVVGTLDFLDHMPLKPLIAYTLRRLGKKLVRQV
jgi:glycosyltransferase involved in cell wall biosynthesis